MVLKKLTQMLLIVDTATLYRVPPCYIMYILPDSVVHTTPDNRVHLFTMLTGYTVHTTQDQITVYIVS